MCMNIWVKTNICDRVRTRLIAPKNSMFKNKLLDLRAMYIFWANQINGINQNQYML